MDKFYNTIHKFNSKIIIRKNVNRINIIRNVIDNIGDYMSSPFRNFNINGEIYDIYNINTIQNNINQVVVGGGGLFHPCFKDEMNKIFRRDNYKIILWGCGLNEHGKISSSYDINMLKKCTLIGIRDYGVGLPWVPCSSCMHFAFDQKYSILNKIVIYEHKCFPISNTLPYPRMNNTSNFIDVINFLGTAEYIITSSYHGVYWSTLLNKKVFCKPFSSKFFYLKYKPIFIENYKINGEPDNFPNALIECRKANKAFYKTLLSLPS